MRERLDELVLEHGKGDTLTHGTAEVLAECDEGHADGYLVRVGR